MALSNIFREPRREITESAAGITVFVAFVYLDYLFAKWFHDVTATTSLGGCPLPLGLVFGLLAAAILVLLLFITHAIGEGVCGFLARRGLELRPKQRY